MNTRITWYCLLALILNVSSSFQQDVTQSSYSRATDELENRLEKKLVDRLEKRMSIIFRENMIPIHSSLNTIEDSVSVIRDDINNLESLFEQKLSDHLDKCSKHTNESFWKLEKDLAEVKVNLTVMDYTSASLQKDQSTEGHWSTTPIPTTNSSVSELVFWWAADNDDMNKVKEALASGTDVNWRNWYNSSALHAAAALNHSAVAEVLLAAGADKNGQDRDGETPIYRASFHGSTDVIRTLIAYGADVNIPSKAGFTPLHLAAHRNYPDIAQQLLRAGANTQMQNVLGNTPADQARREGHNDLATMIDNYPDHVSAG